MKMRWSTQLELRQGQYCWWNEGRAQLEESSSPLGPVIWVVEASSWPPGEDSSELILGEAEEACVQWEERKCHS